MSDKPWSEERSIAEAEALVATWDKVLDPEQMRVLRYEIVHVLNCVMNQEGAYWVNQHADAENALRAQLAAAQSEVARLNALGIAQLERDKAMLQARVWELEAAQEWEVVPDGVYGNVDTITLSKDGTFIEIYSAYGDGSRRHRAMMPLPEGWQLMRRKEATNG